MLTFECPLCHAKLPATAEATGEALPCSRCQQSAITAAANLAPSFPTLSVHTMPKQAHGSLPTWKHRGDRNADTLQGKIGWTTRDYVNIGVAICVIATTIGLVLPVLAALRGANGHIEGVNRLREKGMER